MWAGGSLDPSKSKRKTCLRLVSFSPTSLRLIALVIRQDETWLRMTMVHAFVHPISHCEGTNTSSCAVCLPGTEKSHWRSGYADSNPEFPQTVSVILFLSFRPCV
ncbi:hypothetical protein M752DRAFT_111479 [Aspergillus phoenicis ATCC 13157]|uniref:Uncharacterized protein n=1 Tax=Aspergillus phoenicis ATCC 13157 TaxID=1353007 RepID=A0A370P4B4_ASPPH|nr:hypothetical protein M752DRAFT_111479 [Aspergillus phoenicis ATCC 13157]